MPEFHPPAEPREVHQVQHAEHTVYVVRCWPVDCNALADWCDSVLGRDFFFKRRHLESILERRNNFVWSIVVDDVCSGLVILYDGSILHNLYVDPTIRGSGIGTAVLQHFRPKRIRSKTNMLAGDPTDFYLRNGYVVDQPDPTRPHIIDMVLPQGSAGLGVTDPGTYPPNGAARPSNNGHRTAEELAENLASSRVTSGNAVPVENHAPPAEARARGVLVNGVTSSPSASRVATPRPNCPPEAAAAQSMLADGNHVVLTLDEYNALATLKKNRDRIAAYRAKRKAEKSATV